MASNPTITLGSPTIHNVSLMHSGILPDLDYYNVATNEPRFFLSFDVFQNGVLEFTGDHVEAECPYSYFGNTTLELPRHVLCHPTECARYLWRVIPWANRILQCIDGCVVRRLIREMGSYAYRFAMAGNFSGFQMQSTLTVDFSETVIVTMPANHGASETALNKLTAESFHVSETMEKGDCVICLEEFSGETALTRMTCSHVFHQSCLFEWLKNSVSCPLCRSKVEDD